MSQQIDNIQRSNLNQRGSSNKWNGFYRALVIDCKDEKQLGRVKVRIPDLMPELGEFKTLEWTDNGLWAHPGNNYLGGRNVFDMNIEDRAKGPSAFFEDGWYQGSCLIPPAGSWIWVFFENGDPNHPYYFGALEAGQRQVLPENLTGAEYWKKWTLIKTKEGRSIVFSDDPEDARVMITGKKRMMTNEPDGDLDSVFLEEGNQTFICIKEVPGEETLLIKDYRGNFITFHVNDSVAIDQLHVYFQNDIHIETLTNMFIKTGEELHVDVGTNYYRTSGGTMDIKAEDAYYQKADSFDRFSMSHDKRTALSQIADTAASTITHCAGSRMECASGATMRMTSTSTHVRGFANARVTGDGVLDLHSEGIIRIQGAITDIQNFSASAFSAFSITIASLATSAIPAEPIGLLDIQPNPQDSPIPPIPEGDIESP